MSHGINITRTFAAPREKVFEAWVKPEHFSVWFGSEAIAVPLDTLKMDVRKGGSWSAVMLLPDGTSKAWVGEYLEIDPPTKLVKTMTDHPESPNRATITVLFAEVEGGTEMTMKQVGGNLSEEDCKRATAGYGSFFDSMENLFV
ncbi:unnamed protein product [Calypogeia fissa]